MSARCQKPKCPLGTFYFLLIIPYNTTMTLTTHAVIAAAVAKPLAAAHPLFSFCAGIASHYLSDMIPHWAYKLHALTVDNAGGKRLEPTHTFFHIDFPKIAFDCMLGTTIVFLITWPASWHDAIRIALAVIGGVLPDALQGMYHFLKRPSFLVPIQRFHDMVHTKIILDPYPLIGIPFQAFIFLLSIFFLI